MSAIVKAHAAAEAADITKAARGPWVFEPHCGYGKSNPEGEPYPFGYLSVGPLIMPVFELRQVINRSADEMYGSAALIVRAVNERDELIAQRDELAAALEELVALVRGECPSLLDDDRGSLGRLSAQIDAVLAKVKAVQS